MKTTTIRRLVTLAIEQVFQEEQFARSRADGLAEYILNNSSLIVSHDNSIDLVQGNMLGVGESNKDKELEIPRYVVFGLKELADNSKMVYKWRLRGMSDFQSVNSFILCNHSRNTNMAVLVKAEPLNYAIVKSIVPDEERGVMVYRDIVWDRPVYEVSYLQNHRVYVEKFSSKAMLEGRMKELISRDVMRLRVFSLLDDKKHLGFRMQGNIYQSGGRSEIIERNLKVIWDYQHYRDNIDAIMHISDGHI